MVSRNFYPIFAPYMVKGILHIQAQNITVAHRVPRAAWFEIMLVNALMA
jgi:hypothetical protein